MYVVDDWEVEREDVDIGTELGKGSFGMVYKGTFKDPKKVWILSKRRLEGNFSWSLL